MSAKRQIYLSNRGTKNYFKYKSFLVWLWLLPLLELNFPTTIENLAEPINTPEDEFAPSLTQDGRELFFNARKAGERYMDIYHSVLGQDNKFSPPKKVEEICSFYNEETPFIAPDGSYLIFASDRDGSKEMPRDAQGIIRISLDLYIAYRQKNGFSKPTPLPGKVNTPHHEKAPYLHSDGYLYFTRYPFGNIQQAQILRAKQLPDGSFGEAEVLPPQINSGHQELSLTAAPHGFYFSSRRAGSQGWDIYYIAYSPESNQQKEYWGQAIRLPEPINSEGNETFLTHRGNLLYFSSNRQGGRGGFDIYVARETIPEITLHFWVRDKKNQQPIVSQVWLAAQSKDEPAAKVTLEKETNDKGYFNAILLPQVNSIEVRVEAPGYLPLYREFDLAKLNNGSEIILELEAIEKDASFTIPQIHFDYNSALLRKESLPYLNTLSQYLLKHPHLKIRIIGHSDLTGSEEFNLKLSLERAKAIKAYLEKQGIKAERIETEGAGKSRPLVKGKDATAAALNRRSEFKIIEP